ncbi:MAG: ABC transporter substrate-binding protein [Bdellovibrionales bacterium]|nr:ABC transporter substrate-binding protein [Bdellovibrionales bacterium]
MANQGSPPASIRINVDAMPVNLEPPLLTDTNTAWLLHHLGDRLVEEHRVGHLKGNLAAQWTISDDKRTYRFRIKTGEKFSDGKKLEAQDVVDSLARAKKHGEHSRVGFYLKNIEAVSLKDGDSVEVILKKPASNFLQILSDASFTIYRPCKAVGGFCFTGDFELVSLGEKSVEMRARESGQAFVLEQMSFDEAAQKFQSGSLEVLRSYGMENLPLIRKTAKQRVVMPDERSFFFAFNTKSKVFTALKSREAVVHAMNTEALGKALEERGLTRSHSLLSPSLVFGHKEFQKDVESRSSADAVPPKGFTVLMMKAYKLEPLAKAALGHLNPVYRNLEKADFLSEMRKGHYDLILMGYGLTVRDWDYLSTLFHSDSLHNFIKLHDAEVDEFLVKSREEIEPSKRIGLYAQVLEKNRANLWYIPVAHVPLLFGISDKLTLDPPLEETTITSPFFYLGKLSWKK